MTLEQFKNKLTDLRFANAFNPYVDTCQQYDTDRSSEQRLKIMTALLKQAIERDVDALWVGRDLGYRGGRRTGLALTDDVNFHKHIARWELEDQSLPTDGQAVAERSATVVWSILSPIKQRIFLWNVFPLHPYQLGNPFSNRSHTPAERQAGEGILDALISMIKPKNIVAIGKDAAVSVERLGHDCNHVRHPSYGGQMIFIQQMTELYGNYDM